MSPEFKQFVSALSDTATLGTWLSLDLAQNATTQEDLIHQAKEVIAASKKATEAYNRLSETEQRAFHAEG